MRKTFDKLLFVSKINTITKRNEIFQEFSYFGWVESLRLIKRKGIAFVEMSSSIEAENAILGLDGVEISGSKIRVEKARYKDRN